MTNPIVPNDTAAVKTVEELHAAYLGAVAASTAAFGTLLQHTDDRGAQQTYDRLLQAEQRAYQEWHEADERAYEAYLCAQHDQECPLEYPDTYEDPIPYTLTSAGFRYLERHVPTRRPAAETDLPF